MSSMWKRVVAAIAVWAGVSVCAAEPLKVLSVGNSFSVNAHAFLDEIAQAMGRDLLLRNAAISGGPIQGHVQQIHAYESSTNAPVRRGQPYVIDGVKTSLPELLQSQRWDIVTIQQFSWHSRDASTYEPEGTELIGYIRRLAPQAEIVVYETWAYREDEQRLVHADMTPGQMYADVSKAYRLFASRHGLRVLPGGLAFNLAQAASIRARAVRDAFGPDGVLSLKSLYAEDGCHAGLDGEYLLGCVWFEFLFGEDARAVRFIPEGMSANDAAALREIAHRAVTLEKAAKPEGK